MAHEPRGESDGCEPLRVCGARELAEHLRELRVRAAREHELQRVRGRRPLRLPDPMAVAGIAGRVHLVAAADADVEEELGVRISRRRELRVGGASGD